MERQTDRMTDRCVLTMRMSPIVTDQLVDHRLKEMWSPSSTDCNPLDYFMWCVVEREVNKWPHITLACLKVMTSDVMTDLDREVIIHACQSLGLGLSLLWRQLGFSSNKYVCYININLMDLHASNTLHTGRINHMCINSSITLQKTIGKVSSKYQEKY